MQGGIGLATRTPDRPGAGGLPALLVRWLLARLLYLLAIILITVPLIFLRAGAIPRRLMLPEFRLDRYWPALKQYVSHLLDGSFGPLYQAPPGGWAAPKPVPSNAQISDMLSRAWPTSLSLFLLALLVGLLGGLLVGLVVSRFGRGKVRGAVSSVNLALLSFPDLLLVVLAQWGIMALTPLLGFELVPPFGTWNGVLTGRTLILPVLLLSVFPGAYIGRIAAAAFDEAYSSDYIRTARSKGLTNRRVVFGHALRNALIPILAGLPTATGLMISNLIVIEWIMNLQGFGKLLSLEFKAHYPSPNLISSIAIILIALFVLIDGLVDGLLLWLDPKARDRSEQDRLERRPQAVTGPRPSLAERLGTAGEALAEAGRQVVSLLGGLASRQTRIRLISAYRGNLPLIVGTSILALVIFAAIFAPKLALTGPYQMKPVMVLDGVWRMPPFKPNPENPLGTDKLGRDMYSRLLFGARYTLLIALAIVPARILLAMPLGLAAGWLRGNWERWIRRLATIFGGLPLLVISAVLVPVIFVEPQAASLANPYAPPPPDPNHIMLLHSAIMIFLGWPRLAETIRLMTRDVAERPFIEGAHAAGAGGGRVMFRHILPNIAPHLLVMGAAETAWLMMFLTQLGVFGIFLGGTFALEGVGQVPLYPDWAHMLVNPTQSLHQHQWMILWPALAFFVTILSLHLIAEGTRQASLPRQIAVRPDADGEPAMAVSAGD